MQPTVVRGRFISEADGLPYDGRIAFEPQRLWFKGADGLHYAALSVDVPLVDGIFAVELTPAINYKVTCPVGVWTVQAPVKLNGEPVLLSNLLPSRFRAI